MQNMYTLGLAAAGTIGLYVMSTTPSVIAGAFTAAMFVCIGIMQKQRKVDS